MAASRRNRQPSLATPTSGVCSSQLEGEREAWKFRGTSSFDGKKMHRVVNGNANAAALPMSGLPPREEKRDFFELRRTL